MNATDEAGNRTTVSVKGGKVTSFEGGKPKEDLGNLNLKTNQDFLDKELSPYQTKIKNLVKEGNALSKVKVKGGASDTRITKLSQKIALLEDPSNMTTLTRSEKLSLRNAQIKLKELSNVKDVASNAPKRLDTINLKLAELDHQVGQIHNKYDPETLDQKVFTGANDKKYTIGQATQSEITKNTGQKYYVDPELTSLLNYADSKVALENTRFVEGTKSVLEDKGLAVKEGETPPKGFKTTTNPYFRGYKMEPKLAEVLNDITGKSTDGTHVLKTIGNVLRQTIVYLPIKHDFNELAGYTIDRGIHWLNPLDYPRIGKSLVAAAKDVATQSDFYRQMLRSGSTMMTADDSKLGKVVSDQIKNTLENKKSVGDIAKAFGMSPVTTYKAIQKVTVWDVQDILNIARVRERMMSGGLKKGMNFDDALKATEKTNFQYKVPSRVALPGVAGRDAAKFLKGDATYFGAYTYDKFRIAKNIVKDTVNPKTLIKNPGKNLEAAGQLGATVAIASLLWPQVNKGLQAVTGNKNAHITAPGVGSVAELAQKAIQHKAGLSQLGGQVSLSAPVTLGSQLIGNTDSFTKKQIWDPNATSAQKSDAIGKWLFSQLSPTQKVASSKNASQNTVLSTVLSLAGASIPKNSPATTQLESLKYDTLPGIQSSAKSKAASGDIQGAIGIIAQYDQRILASAQAAAKADGKPMPTVAQLKSAGYYYDPTHATVNSWAKAKTSTTALGTILNKTPTPKKGQPGYYLYEKQKAATAKQTKLQNRLNPSNKQPVI